MNNFIFLDTVLIGGDTQNTDQNSAPAANDTTATTTTTTTGVASAPAAGPLGFGGGGSSSFIMIAYIIGLVVLFYFFAIRPQKKRDKEHKETLNSIKVGDSVITSGGFYGKVVNTADEVFVVEFGTNKTVMIPIRKSEIVGKKEPNLSTTESKE